MGRDEEIGEDIIGVSSVRPGRDTLAHRVLARVYADEVLATEGARRVVVAHGGHSKKRKKNDALAAKAEEMARELPGGSRVVAAPTEEFLDLAREHCAPGSTPARQLEFAVLLEEYARQLLADIPGTKENVSKPPHRETRERARRNQRLQRSLELHSEENGIFSVAEGVREDS